MTPFNDIAKPAAVVATLDYNDRINDLFREAFIISIQAYGEDKEKLSNILTYIKRIIANINPCGIFTDEGVVDITKPFINGTATRDFITNLYFGFSAKIDDKDHLALVNRLTRACAFYNPKSMYPDVIVQKHADDKTIHSIISANPHILVILMIKACISLSDVDPREQKGNK